MSNEFDIDELDAPEINAPELDTPEDEGPIDPELEPPKPAVAPAATVKDVQALETAQKTKRMLDAQKKVKIRVPSTETDKDPVVVGVNGYIYQIKRDEWVEVPDSVCRVLDNAKFTIYTQKKREDGEGNELIESEAQRIAFQTAGNE